MLKNYKKIAFIGAHHDDIEINCGGTIAKAIDQGSQVQTVIMGSGTYYHYSGKISRNASVAQNESAKAADELGLPRANVTCFDLPEKNIAYNSKTVELINRFLDSFGPDLIITHWLHDTHQDHINVAKSVISAARYYSSILMWEPIFPSGRNVINPFTPNIYIDISRFHKEKTQAIRCHKTQIAKFRGNGIDILSGITARARYRGFEISKQYAEAYFSYRLSS